MVFALVVITGAVISYYGNQIQLLQAALNETKSSLALTTNNLTTVLEQLELERALIINRQGVRNFKSLEELQEFLANDDTDQQQYIKDTFDCDDFAMMLQERAFEQGYIINCQKLPVGGLNHMDNLAICANDMYFVEAESDVVSYAGFLD
jgi:hypothetical protein